MATGEARKTSNGCVAARRVPRTDARCRQPSVNVAAIDFGTTNCSLAYIIGSDSGEPELLNINGTERRVPTAVLFDEYGVVESLGKIARDGCRNLRGKQLLSWAYFEQIKMELQRDEVGYSTIFATDFLSGDINFLHFACSFNHYSQ